MICTLKPLISADKDNVGFIIPWGKKRQRSSWVDLKNDNLSWLCFSF